MAARRGGLRRRRGPLRADRARPLLRAPVLLQAADPALPRRAGGLARPARLLRPRRAGPDGGARPPVLPAHPRPPPVGLGRALAGRLGAPGLRRRGVAGRDRLQLRRTTRFAAAYAELEEAVYAGCALSLVVTPVDGLVIESAEVSLGGGLTLVRGVDLADGPPELRGDEYATVAVLHARVPARRRAGPRRRRPPAAPPPVRAAPVGRRRAGARPDRLGTHRRRAVARDPARHRPAPHHRRLPARARGRGPAARVLLARRPGARRGRASSPGRCAASSSAASAAPRSRR